MTEPSTPWAQVRELYAQARQQAPEQRAAWLQGQAAPPSVLDEVCSLLAHATPGSSEDGGDAFLAPPVALWAELQAQRTGQRLGQA